jgi:hypothetical protein
MSNMHMVMKYLEEIRAGQKEILLALGRPTFSTEPDGTAPELPVTLFSFKYSIPSSLKHTRVVESQNRLREHQLYL